MIFTVTVMIILRHHKSHPYEMANLRVKCCVCSVSSIDWQFPFSPLLSLPHLSSLSPFFSLSLYPSHPFPLSSFLSSFLPFFICLLVSLSLSLNIDSKSVFKLDKSEIWIFMSFIFERTFQREVLINGGALFLTLFSPNKLIRTLRGYPLSNSHLPPLRLDRLSAIFSTTILTPSSPFPCFMRQFLCSTPNVDE